MPHIVFITRKWPPAVGGMEAYAFMLSRGLAGRARLDVRALPGRRDGRPPSLLRLFGFFSASVPYLAKRKADVLHVGDLVLWPLAWLGGIFGAAPRLAMTAYGLDIVFARRRGLLPWLYRAYLGLGIRCVGHRVVILAISGFTAKLCRDVGFRHVKVVNLGVDKPMNVPARATGDYVLFVGRLVPRKGASWFAREVLPLLPRSIHLVVVGKGWDRAEQVSLFGNERIDYREYVSDEALRELRQASVAVIMPNIPIDGTDVEGFGLTALEAAADGGVLLASDLDGIPDAVIDGETGFLLPAGDAMRWAERIEEIRAWPSEKRADFVNRARDLIEEHYSWDVVVARTLDAYGIGS